jgi:hypothetical protein
MRTGKETEVRKTARDIRLQQMQARAVETVMRNSQWLTASQLAELMNPNIDDPDKVIEEWKAKFLIFSVLREGIEYFPSYALDKENNYQPLTIIAELLKIFEEKKDGLGIAFWCESANSYLGAKSPKDLLKQEPLRVLTAAYDEIAGVLHG